jgi:hypothetical protein
VRKAPLAAAPPSMLRLCCTNSSWLQGLWKKADSQVSFQMRECSCRHRSSGVLRPCQQQRKAIRDGRAAALQALTEHAFQADMSTASMGAPG